jgi:hypothetical protein
LSHPGSSTLGSRLSIYASTAGRYRIHGVDVVVRSNDDAILSRVRETYSWFEVDADLPLGAGPTVEVALTRTADGFTTITNAEGHTGRWHDDDHPLGGLLGAVVAGSILALDGQGILAIHAGVVAIDGRAILVAGQGGHGKTTLVLSLLRRGLELLSDDLALVAPDDRTVLAHPRGLHVRPSAVGLFPELGFLADLPTHRLGAESHWVLDSNHLERAFGATVAGAAQIRAVVLLDGGPSADASPALSVVFGAIGPIELLRWAPLAATDFDGTLTRLGRIVADVPVARLRAGRVDETADAVLSWAMGHVGSRA